MGGIGTYSEKTLHSALKKYFEPDQSKHEQKCFGYIADILNGDHITEIQTGSLRALLGKLRVYLENGMKVTVVHPIAADKWISWVDPESGEVAKRRKSPKRGSYNDAVYDIYGIRELIGNECLTIKLILVDIDEYRYLNGWSKDRKKGSERMDRIPLEIKSSCDFRSSRDYLKLLPKEIPHPFSVKDYMKLTHQSRRSSQCAVALLRSLKLIERVGKDGRAYLYDVIS